MVLWQPPLLKKSSNDQGGTYGTGNSHNYSRQSSKASDISVGIYPGDEIAARKSPVTEAACVIADLVRQNVSCLAFVRARSLTDSIVRDVRHLLVKSSDQALALKVDSCRAGCSTEERRLLERKLQSGETKVLVTRRSALEARIDVGRLDATVHVEVPDTASAMWQQAGRVGWRCVRSVAIVIASEKLLDAYYLEHANELWHREPENATCDPSNTQILDQHLPCAAYEIPIDLRKDAAVFDDKDAAMRLWMNNGGEGYWG